VRQTLSTTHLHTSLIILTLKIIIITIIIIIIIIITLSAKTYSIRLGLVLFTLARRDLLVSCPTRNALITRTEATKGDSRKKSPTLLKGHYFWK